MQNEFNILSLVCQVASGQMDDVGWDGADRDVITAERKQKPQHPGLKVM